MTTKSHDERLALVNAWLSEQGYRNMSGLGDFENGDPMIIVDFVRDDDGQPKQVRNGKFYSDVYFQVSLPNGTLFPYPIRFNCNSLESSGVVFLVRVNGLIVVSFEFRFPAGGFLHGFPRGFPEKSPENATEFIEVPNMGFVKRDSILREFREEVSTQEPQNVQVMSRLFENSSTHCVTPDFVFVDFGNVGDIELGGTENITAELWTPQEVKEALKSGKLCDMHTVSAYGLGCAYDLIS